MTTVTRAAGTSQNSPDVGFRLASFRSAGSASFEPDPIFRSMQLSSIVPWALFGIFIGRTCS
jgi:hypothetical protein